MPIFDPAREAAGRHPKVLRTARSSQKRGEVLKTTPGSQDMRGMPSPAKQVKDVEAYA